MLVLVFLFGLFCVIGGQIDIMKDECLRKVYSCEKYRRMKVTGKNGRYLTNIKKFENMCKENSKFIECILDAYAVCNERCIHDDFPRIAMYRRLSMYSYCRLPKHQEEYFAHVGCINKYEDKLVEKCDIKENTGEDVELACPFVPEACESLKRIAICSFLEMKRFCGIKAAKVYERFYYLKIEKQDIICEVGLNNHLSLCQSKSLDSLSPEKRYRADVTRRTGFSPVKKPTSNLESMSSESINSLVKYFQNTYKTSDSFNRLEAIYEEFRELIEQHEYRREQEIKEYIDVSECPTHNLHLKLNHKPNPKSMVLKQVNTFNKETLRPTSTLECGQETKTFTGEVLLHKDPQRISNYIDLVKDSVLVLYELLNHETTEVIDMGNEHVELNWRNMGSLPIHQMFCSWTVDSSGKIFRCNIEINSIRSYGDYYSEPSLNTRSIEGVEMTEELVENQFFEPKLRSLSTKEFFNLGDFSKREDKQESDSVESFILHNTLEETQIADEADQDQIMETKGSESKANVKSVEFDDYQEKESDDDDEITIARYELLNGPLSKNPIYVKMDDVTTTDTSVNTYDNSYEQSSMSRDSLHGYTHIEDYSEYTIAPEHSTAKNVNEILKQIEPLLREDFKHMKIVTGASTEECGKIVEKVKQS